MARITHVRKAQRRYETRPVLDGFGNQVETAVMREDGTQKTTKTGRKIFMKVTENDLTRPKPDYTCDYCGKPIEVGTAYKHISPKSGPYGGSKRTRHEGCPNWQVWEYSSSLSARLAEISYTASLALADVESADDVSAVVEQAKESIMEIAEEKREAAENIESGFQHETEQSQELAELGDSLESWADEGDSLDINDPEGMDEEEEIDCPVCDGEGKVDSEDGSGTVNCDECEGEGRIENPDYDTDGVSFEEWKENIVSEVEGWLDNSPA
jgi:hypothetical protein